MRGDIRSRLSPACRLAHASKSAPVTISSSRINFRTKVAFFIPARFDRLARIPCSSLLKRTVRTAGIVFLLYAINNACRPNSVANLRKRHGWRLGASIESLFLAPSVFEIRPSQRTVTAIQKGVFLLNFRVVATTVPLETRSPSQPGANLGLFYVNLTIPYQWRIDTSIVPIFSNASLLKTRQFGADQISPLPDLSVTVALKTETILVLNLEHRLTRPLS